MNVLVFDIETVPDVMLGARLHDLDGLSDEDIARAMTAKQVQKTGGSDFLPLYQHRVVAISVLYRSADALKIWSLGSEAAEEQELIARFYDGIARFSPTLVSWNGSGFDLPVLHYRSMIYGIDASRYWELGDEDRSFRYNNYLSRYHWRHVDLMDILAGFNMRAAAPLNQIALMLGFPGKLGLSGAQVWETYLAGRYKEIRDYCETDVLNTYLVYLRWELVRGELSRERYESECERTRKLLEESGEAHLQAFLEAWGEASGSGMPT